LSSTEASFADIASWMDNIMPKLDLIKTELIVFSSKTRVKKAENVHISLVSRCIKSSTSFRNLILVNASAPGSQWILYASQI